VRRRDRIDRRIAAGRLRGRHVRAVARALARPRSGRTIGRGRTPGPLACDRVWVRGRRVRFGVDPGDAAAGAAALARDLAARGARRHAELFAAAWSLATDGYGIYRFLAPPGDGAVPRLIAVGGRVATGKSTLAEAIARRIAAPQVSTDSVRAALLDPLPERVAHELAWEPDFAARVYGGVLARAELALASGRSVVLDGCFRSPEQRRDAAALAERHGAAFVFAVCNSPADEIAARLRHRDARDRVPPGSWRAVAEAANRWWEPPRDDEPGELLSVDTSRRRSAQLRAVGIGAEARA
jgi:predicted kinase